MNNNSHAVASSADDRQQIGERLEEPSTAERFRTLSHEVSLAWKHMALQGWLPKSHVVCKSQGGGAERACMSDVSHLRDLGDFRQPAAAAFLQCTWQSGTDGSMALFSFKCHLIRKEAEVRRSNDA
ncbi:hypothetical protein MMC28_000381 [Mycoblastus sanguinarius]|nr:hypothetical protein [Mycoblastus sanguinarius]